MRISFHNFITICTIPIMSFLVFFPVDIMVGANPFWTNQVPLQFHTFCIHTAIKTSKLVWKANQTVYCMSWMDAESMKLNGKLFQPSRHNDVVTTLLRRRYPTLLWRRSIVAMEMSDDVAKTTSFYYYINYYYFFYSHQKKVLLSHIYKSRLFRPLTYKFYKI